MSCLPLLFDQRDGLGGGVRARPENVPPASSHIELLLEKHGNGEMGVNSECDSESSSSSGIENMTEEMRKETIYN